MYFATVASDMDTEFLKLAMDSRRSPKHVHLTHGPD